MFATATIPSLTQAKKVVAIPGVLLYYSDPAPTLHIRENLPPSVTLAKDIRFYNASGNLPKFTFFSAIAGDAPVVLQGFLKPSDDNGFSLLVGKDKIQVSFKGFEKQNEELLRQNKTHSIPLIYASQNNGWEVRYEDISHFQKSYLLSSLLKSWMGGLTQLLSAVTHEMTTLLQKPRSELKKLVAQQDAQVSSSSVSPAAKNGIFWIWWGLSKPLSVKKWLSRYNDGCLSNAELQMFHREHHPCRAGFYRVWLSDHMDVAGESEPVVDICWFTDHEWVQYELSVIQGKNDSDIAFGPDSSDRAKLGVQNKMVLSGETGSLWSMEDTFGLATAFLVPDYGVNPCPLSRSLGTAKEDMQDLMNARFGPGKALPSDLQSAFMKDATISATSMWKI